MKKFIPLIFGVTLFAASIDFEGEGKLWWSHIQYLADDKLEGRNVGTDGFRKAVEYVTTNFERFGLKPAGTSGYLQPVPFETRQLVPEQSGLSLLSDGKDEAVRLGAEATISARGNREGTIEAQMVFVGYGLAIPEVQYDELAGLDLRGKIAVYVNASGPVQAPGPLKSHYSSGVERWTALRKAGAIGIATIANPRTTGGRGGPPEGAAPNAADNPAGERQNGRGGQSPPPQTTFNLADKELQETTGMALALTISARGGEKFFAGSGHTYEEIVKLARANEPLPKFALRPTVRAKVTYKRSTLKAPNVVGMLQGSDKKLKNEFVILSAHLDHVGVGRQVNGDAIYNGAMDDASGIATILEVARIFKETAAKPKRSVIFLAVTAEEKGELGSRYYASKPTVPAGQIVADINLDMFLPLYPLKVIEVQGLQESTLGETVRLAAKDLGVDVQLDNEPEQNRFIRSDQYSFIRNGVPALAFKFGYTAGSPDEKTRRDWIRDRYHRPSDDLEQPVDRAAAALFNRVILGLVNRVADDEARPHWNDDSFFRRFVKNGKN